MARITHRDLRHLFATIRSESGVDVPTVSRWLGHKDGGTLAMKTYGHLRREHSVAKALKVRFRSGRYEAGQGHSFPGNGIEGRGAALSEPLQTNLNETSALVPSVIDCLTMENPTLIGPTHREGGSGFSARN